MRSAAEGGWPPALDWLHASEQRRLRSLQRAERARCFLAGRWLARQLLAAQCGRPAASLRLTIDADGRSAASDGLWLSISHSGAWVAAAVGPERLGLDLEWPRAGRDWAGMAALIGLVDCATADDFYRHWVLSEAWLKAQARSFSLPELAGLGWLPDEQGEGLLLRHAQGQFLGLVAPSAPLHLPPAWWVAGRWRASVPPHLRT